MTPKEIEVLGWIAQGKSNSEIGIILGSSERTVQKHVQHLLNKLDVDNRVSALVKVRELIGRDAIIPDILSRI